MKAFERHLDNGERSHNNNRIAKSGRNILMAGLIMCCLLSNAQNKDQVITYLENSKSVSITTDNVSFVADAKQSNPEILNFLNWVKVFGQEYNHKYGFLNNATSNNIALTQN